MDKAKLAVETRDLAKIYGDGAEIRALDGVNLQVRAGEFIAIVGPSGSGKSTLLNLIGVLDFPTRGQVLIDGVSLAEVHDLDHFRNRTIGFVFQTHNLLPTLTARENVEIPLYEMKINAGKRKTRAQELLALVDLQDRMEFLPNQLSGGERQRVAIARALVNHPTIILADEPTGNLDSKNTADIMQLLCELNRTQGTTLLLVTHNHEVARATRRVITLRDGKITSDIALHTQFDSDLYDLKVSVLGQAILRGDALPRELQVLAPELKKVLERV